MVEASGALMKAATSQQQEPRGCAEDMVEASGALMKAATSQHGEPQGCA